MRKKNPFNGQNPDTGSDIPGPIRGKLANKDIFYVVRILKNILNMAIKNNN